MTIGRYPRERIEGRLRPVSLAHGHRILCRCRRCSSGITSIWTKNDKPQCDYSDTAVTEYESPPVPVITNLNDRSGTRPVSSVAVVQTGSAINTLSTPISYDHASTRAAADPTPPVGATTVRERIAALDVLRGFALLGILVLNINDFAGPELAHDIPYGAFAGPHATANLVTFYLKWLFFEGKMRGLFSMLFGAGVILITRRMEDRGNGAMAADIYLRRNMLLVAFGVLHCCLIWHGDILFDYGFVALLVLYPLRKLSPKVLLLTGTLLSLVLATWLVIVYVGAGHDISLQHQATALAAQERTGVRLDPAQQEVIKEWQKTVADHRVTAESIAKDIATANHSYLQSVFDRSREFRDYFVRGHMLFLSDNLSAMLIGMGLMRMGFLTAELPYLSYVLTALIGFAISLPVYAVGLAKSVASQLDFITLDEWLFAPYYLTREAGMLAIAALLIIVIKSGHLRRAQRALAAVGQTALTNYLMTSILCQTLFVWGPWKLYGRLEYFQLNFVIAAVWAVNLAFSTLWLRKFAFGPVEWVWRCLTYLRREPLRLAEHPAMDASKGKNHFANA